MTTDPKPKMTPPMTDYELLECLDAFAQVNLCKEPPLTYTSWLLDRSAERIKELLATLDRRREVSRALREACRAWDAYFTRLDAESEPGDRLAEERRRYHRGRMELTREALAAADRLDRSEGRPPRRIEGAARAEGCTCTPACGGDCKGGCGCAVCRDAHEGFLSEERGRLPGAPGGLDTV